MKCICKAWKRKCLSTALSLTLAGAAAFPSAAEETGTSIAEEAAAAAMKKKGDHTPVSSLTKAQFNEYAKEGRALLKESKEGR